MANPFPFVAGDVLTAAELNGIGEMLSYTPTTTNVTLGNGSFGANYVRVQKLVYVQIGISFGSTTAFTGAPTFTLPVTAAATNQALPGIASMLDSGVTFYLGGVTLTTTTVSPYVSLANGTYLNTPTGNVSATVPMTWATNDIMLLRFVYEAA
jgi:hypothetical protein